MGSGCHKLHVDVLLSLFRCPGNAGRGTVAGMYVLATHGSLLDLFMAQRRLRVWNGSQKLRGGRRSNSTCRPGYCHGRVVALCRRISESKRRGTWGADGNRPTRLVSHHRSAAAAGLLACPLRRFDGGTRKSTAANTPPSQTHPVSKLPSSPVITYGVLSRPQSNLEPISNHRLVRSIALFLARCSWPPRSYTIAEYAFNSGANCCGSFDSRRSKSTTTTTRRKRPS